MELIKIIFFAIGTFFGIENSQIAAEKTTVTIDPTTKTIVVLQENLFSVIRTEEDSLRVSEQLLAIKKSDTSWSPELKNYASKTYELYTTDAGELNAKIVLTYQTATNLSDYAVDLSKDGHYSLINIPRWNVQTTDGTLNGNYWNFDAETKFTFTLDPFKEMPNEYKVDKKSMQPFWEKIKE